MKVSRSALLPFSASQMFSLVDDVESYPQFLNWCQSVDVVERNLSDVIAKMNIAYGKLAFAFTTKNTIMPDQRINLELVQGPFSNFAGHWKFTPLQSSAHQMEQGGLQGCKVSLELDFDFQSGFASGMLAKVFEKITASQLDAFEQRAHALFK